MRKIIWYGILLCFILGFAAFAYGFTGSFYTTEGWGKEIKAPGAATAAPTGSPRTLPTQPPALKTGDFNFLVLGDSLAYGTGDLQEKGFHGYLADKIKSTANKSIGLNNLAVEGIRTIELSQQVFSPGFGDLLKNTDFIFVSIGGNDVRGIARLQGGEKEKGFETAQKAYLDNLSRILEKIRQDNPKVKIIFLGLYNLNYEQDVYENALLLSQWNQKTQSLVESNPNGVFIPTTDLFKFNFSNYMSPDNIHPNGKGYQAIADRMYESISSLFSEE